MAETVSDAPYDPASDRILTADHCFLCGSDLRVSRRTDEHVFPAWLLRMFDLWNAELNLLNTTGIPYRQLRIPCCASCNSGVLSPLEGRVKTAVQSGYDALLRLDERFIYQWLLKIFYGLLFKELSLPLDRSDPTKGPIVMPELVEELRTTHTMLQSMRFPTEFEPTPPWSVFVFRCHDYPEAALNFDFYDSLESMTAAIRMGEVAVIACLQDNSTHKQVYGDFFKRFQSQPLHPIQFAELTSMVFYKESLCNRTPKYITRLPDSEGDRMQVIALPLQGLSAKPIYDDWNQADYAKVLSQFTRLPIDTIFREPDEVMSWVRKPDGSVTVMAAHDRL